MHYCTQWACPDVRTSDCAVSCCYRAVALPGTNHGTALLCSSIGEKTVVTVFMQALNDCGVTSAQSAAHLDAVSALQLELMQWRMIHARFLSGVVPLMLNVIFLITTEWLSQTWS